MRAHYTALRGSEPRVGRAVSRDERAHRHCGGVRAEQRDVCTCTLARRCLDNRVFAACLHGVARLAVACTRAACLPERSRRARRADVHARCFGLISLDVLHVDVAIRHETTNEMTTNEMTTSGMTTSETSKTSEKKYQTSGCACGPKNCETKRPSAQAPDPKNSKRTQTRQELCHLLRYTDEMRETSKASETKHEASGCACELQDPQAHETKSARLGPRAQESDQEHPSAADRSCAHFVPLGSGRRRPRCSRTRR